MLFQKSIEDELGEIVKYITWLEEQYKLVTHSIEIRDKYIKTGQRISLHRQTLWSWKFFRQNTRDRIQSDLERLLKEEADIEEQNDLIG